MGSASVMVDSHVETRGVDALEVPIEDVLEVVEIVVLSANGVIVGLCDGESVLPSIVLSHGLSEVAIVAVEDILEVFGADADIGHGIVAVGTIGRALLGSDLHHANLTSTTVCIRVAAGLLECNGSEEDGRNASLIRHGREHVEIGLASSEWVSVFLENFGEVTIDEVIKSDWGRNPTITINAAVEPVLISIGTAGSSRIRNSIRVSAWRARGLNDGPSTSLRCVCTIGGRRSRCRGRIRRGGLIGGRGAVRVRVGGRRSIGSSVGRLVGGVDGHVDGSDTLIISVVCAIVVGRRWVSSSLSIGRIYRARSRMMMVVPLLQLFPLFLVTGETATDHARCGIALEHFGRVKVWLGAALAIGKRSSVNASDCDFWCLRVCGNVDGLCEGGGGRESNGSEKSSEMHRG